MIRKLKTKSFLALAGGLFLNSQAGATVLIQNNFDGSPITGGALQTLSNGVGGAGTFDPNTGVITTTNGNNNTTGFNSSVLETFDSDVFDTLTVTFDVAAADVSLASANGFFLGLVTGTDATATDGDGLFNNNPNAIGLQFRDNGGANNQILETNGVGDGLGTVIGSLPLITDASLADGFTFTLTLNDNDTFDAVSTGLSTNINLTGVTFGANGASFEDFSNGVGVNSTLQTNFADGPSSSSFTFNSVTLEATTIPEPSSAVLLVGGLGCLAFRRKRQK